MTTEIHKLDMDDTAPSLAEKLLRIREYSDLTIVCDGHEFKVHRAYACAQSPVIAAALKGSFMEAKTGVLNMSFDVESVRRFIEFLYTGDYHVSPDPAVELLSSTAPDEACATDIQAEKSVDITAAPDQSLLAQLLPAQALPEPEACILESADEISARAKCHGRMNCMADYYAVPALAVLSRIKAQKSLSVEWSAESFCDLAQQSIGSTGDKNFLHMLADSASDHIHELFEYRTFEDVGIAESLAPYILPKVASRLKTASQKIKDLTKPVPFVTQRR